MTNLRILNINLAKSLNLKTIPDLTDSIQLEELTLENCQLKHLTSSFCVNKKALKKLDLTRNELNSLAFIFDRCDHLNLLDLSYNRLVSIRHMFNRDSQLLYLVVDQNQIESVGVNDLKYLDKLLELSIAFNKLEFIHVNVSYFT